MIQVSKKLTVADYKELFPAYRRVISLVYAFNIIEDKYGEDTIFSHEQYSTCDELYQKFREYIESATEFIVFDTLGEVDYSKAKKFSNKLLDETTGHGLNEKAARFRERYEPLVPKDHLERGFIGLLIYKKAKKEVLLIDAERELHITRPDQIDMDRTLMRIKLPRHYKKMEKEMQKIFNSIGFSGPNPEEDYKKMVEGA